MYMKKFICPILFLCIVFFVNTSISFSDEEAPTFYNSYDGAVIGARAIGIGETFVAVADNADAIYWNPAGLVQNKANMFTVGFNVQTVTKDELNQLLTKDPLRGGKLIYLAFTGNQGGLSWRPLSNLKENTFTEDIQTDTKTWEEKEIKINEFLLSLAVPYTEKMDTGFNINYLSGHIAISTKSMTTGTWNEPSANVCSGNGFGLDFGILYKVTPFMNLGVMLKNVVAYMYWDDYKRDKLPVTLRTGTAVKLTNLLTFAYDVEKTFYSGRENLEIYHMGLEQLFFKAISLRTGIYGRNWDKPKEVTYTFGLGYCKDNYFFDLALRKYFVNLAPEEDIPNYTNEVVYTYLCSVTIPF